MVLKVGTRIVQPLDMKDAGDHYGSPELTCLLTYQSWVTEWRWYDYARRHPHCVPNLLIDRALCEEPFLDAFAATPAERQPGISGVCRCRKPKEGARFIYRTRIDPHVAEALGVPQLQPYFVVAALRVEKVYESHEAASRHFTPRRYVAAPNPTPYPPNLVFAPEPVATVRRESCIVFRAIPEDSLTIDPEKRKPLLPSESSECNLRSTYQGYRARVSSRRLQAAICRIEIVNDREALALDPASAPRLSVEECKMWREVGNGRRLSEKSAEDLRGRIAEVGRSAY